MAYMSDMDVPSVRDSDARLRLREPQFDLMLKVLGVEKPREIAELIGVSRRTLERARMGRFGGDFVARTVCGLRQHGDRLARYGLRPSLDELFEVTDEAESVAP